MKNKRLISHIKGGFSLIEMVVVIIIIGILLGGLMKMTGATTGAKVSTLNQNIINSATAATTWSQQDNDGSYDGISYDKLVQAKLLDSSWKGKALSKNPFAGGLSIASAENGNAYIVTANKIPKEVCAKYGSSSGTHKIEIASADSWSCSGSILKVGFGTDVTVGK